VFRRLAPAIGLAAGLAAAMFPVLARAQVNIDQGKSPAEIYTNDCATCHKTLRGLAVGKNSLMLSSFLREHYTASPEQASALAAYVLGAGGREPAPQASKPKPDLEHARAEEPKAGEPKPGEPKPGEPKPGEPKPGEPKTAAHPLGASAKPEEEKRSTEQEAKHEEHAAPTPATNETPGTAATPSPAFGPALSPASNPETSPTTSAAIPAEEQPTAGVTVPRDNIPD